MSDKLAISAAFSVLLMAGYALLGQDSVRVELGPDRLPTTLSVEAPEPLRLADLLPTLR